MKMSRYNIQSHYAGTQDQQNSYNQIQSIPGWNPGHLQSTSYGSTTYTNASDCHVKPYVWASNNFQGFPTEANSMNMQPDVYEWDDVDMLMMTAFIRNLEIQPQPQPQLEPEPEPQHHQPQPQRHPASVLPQSLYQPQRQLLPSDVDAHANARVLPQFLPSVLPRSHLSNPTQQSIMRILSYHNVPCNSPYCEYCKFAEINNVQN